MDYRIVKEDEVKTEPMTEFTSSEIAVTMAEFMLSGLTSVPEDMRQAFKQFCVMFSNAVALGNIESCEMIEWAIAFREICVLLEFGDNDMARNLMGEYLMLAQLSRSKKGMTTMYGLRGVTQKTVEMLEPPKQEEEVQQRRGLISRIVGGIRGR